MRRTPLESFFFPVSPENPPISIESFLSLLCGKEARMTCPASREVSSSPPPLLTAKVRKRLFSLAEAQKNRPPLRKRAFVKFATKKSSIYRPCKVALHSICPFSAGYFVETFHFPDHNRLQHHFESERERARFSRAGGRRGNVRNKKGIISLICGVECSHTMLTNQGTMSPCVSKTFHETS